MTSTAAIDRELGEALDAGLNALAASLPRDARDDLLAYITLLAKWNRTYNLTAIREPARMITHHVLDSLAVLAGIVAIRTFLSFSLEVEIEGRWPWQRRPGEER